MDRGTHLHHEPDVVLDEQDRHPLRRERAQQRGEGLRLAVTQTRRRLVEQQQARPRGEGATQLAEAGQAGRQARRPARRPRRAGRRDRGSRRRRGAGSSRGREPIGGGSRPRRECSRASLRLPNTSSCWNVRAMPRRARCRRRLVRDVASVERQRAVAHALASPVIALKIVVLPAPFGPMSPVTQPRLDVEVDLVRRRCDRRSGSVSPRASNSAIAVLRREAQLAFERAQLRDRDADRVSPTSSGIRRRRGATRSARRAGPAAARRSSRARRGSRCAGR